MVREVSMLSPGRSVVPHVSQSARTSQRTRTGKRSHAVGRAGVKRSGTKSVLSWSSRPVKLARSGATWNGAAPPRRIIQIAEAPRIIQPVVPPAVQAPVRARRVHYDSPFTAEAFANDGLSPFGNVKHPDYVSEYQLTHRFWRQDIDKPVCVKLPAVVHLGSRTPAAFYVGTILSICHAKSEYNVRTPP
jgi:hypothetical protein